MTVALIAYYLGPRLGIGQYLDRLLPPLAASLSAQDIDFTILSSPNAFDKTPAIQQLKSSLASGLIGPSDAQSKNSIKRSVEVLPQLDYAPGKRYLWLATQFKAYCRDRNIDLVVWLSNPVVLPWHPPTIAVIHDVNEWKAKEKYGSRIQTALRSLVYLDASIQFSKAIIAVSKATAADLLYFRPQLKNTGELKIVSNGADSALSSLPEVKIARSDCPFLLSVGRIDPVAKRLPAALGLVQSLRAQSGQPWELQLVGGMNASTQSEGEAFLQSALSRDWVHYQGHVEDAALAQWYRQAAAVVYLSDSEGFGLPIAEAASFTQWIVVNRANQAAVEVGEGAIVPIDPDNLAQAAKQVLEALNSDAQPRPTRDLPTWKAAADGYAQAIDVCLDRSRTPLS